VALVGLLAFWMVNGLVVPRVVADLSERLHPTPSAGSLWAAMREDMASGIDGHNPSEARQKELERRVLAEYRVAKIEELPVSFAGIALQEGEEYGNRIFDKHFGALWDTYARQERVHLLASLAAPLVAVRAASMGFSGSDLAHHRHFVSEAEQHRRELQRHLNGEMTRSAKGLDFTYRAPASFWASGPRFDYRPPGFAWAFERQAGALAALAGWLVLAALLATVAVARQRPA
jgi:ABC-2 type transport system permease protein